MHASACSMCVLCVSPQSHMYVLGLRGRRFVRWCRGWFHVTRTYSAPMPLGPGVAAQGMTGGRCLKVTHTAHSLLHSSVL